MKDWKILIADGLDENGQAVLRSEAIVDDRSEISAAELLETVGGYDALVVRGRTKVTRAVLTAGQKLKVVGRAGVGVDNIDLEAARERQVRVVNAPQSTSLAVAELTLALLLAVARQVASADHSMKEGKWLKKQLEGVELNGRTLGIIGIGNIGRAVAARAAAFGMQVVAYDNTISEAEVSQRGANPVSLEALYAQADYITLHVPLTPQTRGMIGAQAIAQMKPGVRLVCTARGGVIDEGALLEALNSGQVAAAGLDVFAAEPPGLSSLVAHPNVTATPHIGAQTAEAQKRASVDIAYEVLAALNGKPLRWQIA